MCVRRLLFLVFFALIASLAQVHADNSIDLLGPEFSACSGFGRVDMGNIASSKDYWALVQIEPDSKSGLTIHNQVWNKDHTDLITNPKNPLTEIPISGKYTILCQLSGKSQLKSGSYLWRDHAMALSLDAPASPQEKEEQRRYMIDQICSSDHPGKQTNVLCRIHPEATGRAYFSDMVVVSSEWNQYFEPAFRYLRAHPKVLDVVLSTKSQAACHELTKSSNPVLAVVAFETLMSHNQIETDEMGKLWETAPPVVAEVFVFRAYYGGWLDTPDHLTWACSWASSAKSTTELKVVTVGLIAAGSYIDGVSDFSTRDEKRILPAWDVRRKIFAAIRERATALHAASQGSDPDYDFVNGVFGPNRK